MLTMRQRHRASQRSRPRSRRRPAPIYYFRRGRAAPINPALSDLFTLLYRRREAVACRALIHPQYTNLHRLAKLIEGPRNVIVNRSAMGYEMVIAPSISVEREAGSPTSPAGGSISP